MKKHLSFLALLTTATVLSYGQANTNLSNLTSPTAVNQSLIPNNNNRNLGSAAKSWKILYLGNSMYLNDTLFLHNKGTYNTFIGMQAGKSITTGTYNTGSGWYALAANTTGVQNAAFGTSALYSNTNGSQNTALGKAVLYKNIDGSFNSGSGYQALFNNDHGNYNTASGAYSLFINQSGSYNTATGFSALRVNSSGGLNSAFGESALYNNTIGGYNTATGEKSLYSNTFGSYNTASGNAALYSNVSGDRNTALGYNALYANTTGTQNTAIGNNAYFLEGNDNNTTCIGYNSGGVGGGSNRIEIGNTSVTWIGGEVGWSTYSDGRVKENVKQNVPGLLFINKLRPVSYNYNIHKQNTMLYKDKKNQTDWSSKYDIEKQRFTGFIAQDVEKAANDSKYEFSGLVKPTNDNDLYSLRYSDFVVPLVKAVQELSSQNDSLKQSNQVLNDKLNTLFNRINQIETVMSKCGNSFSSGMQSDDNKTSSSKFSDMAKLGQNTPNPFSSATNIQYNIPANFKSARIMITNENGTIIKQLSLNNAGKGVININAGNFNSGTYTYSLVVNGIILESKKMIVGK